MDYYICIIYNLFPLKTVLIAICTHGQWYWEKHLITKLLSVPFQKLQGSLTQQRNGGLAVKKSLEEC